MRRRLTMALTKSHKVTAGPERGATQSEGKRVAIRTTSVKVVDRDTVVEIFSQLRDLLDAYLEEVNDRVVTVPSKAPLDRQEEMPYDDVPWPSDEE